MEPLLSSLRRAYAQLPHPVQRCVVLALGATVFWASWGVSRAWRAWRLRRRFGRARALERQARRLLRRRGYRVVAEQEARQVTLLVDGQPQDYLIRADYLVRDSQGTLLVAEVKSGLLATDPLHLPTRRQLLDYQHGYRDAAGVLLVDMQRARVRRVCFPD